MGTLSHILQSDLAQRISGAKTYADPSKLLVAGQRAKTHFLVLDRDLLTDAGLTPAEGQYYLMPATGTIAGGWATAGLLNNEIAAYTSGAWTRYTPAEGDTVDIADENITQRFDGAAWGPLLSIFAAQSAAPPATPGIVARVADGVSGADNLGALGYSALYSLTSYPTDISAEAGAARTITVNNTTKTITASSGSFVTDRFQAGHEVMFDYGTAGAGNNWKRVTLVSVTALSMTYTGTLADLSASTTARLRRISQNYIPLDLWAVTGTNGSSVSLAHDPYGRSGFPKFSIELGGFGTLVAGSISARTVTDPPDIYGVYAEGTPDNPLPNNIAGVVGTTFYSIIHDGVALTAHQSTLTEINAATQRTKQATAGAPISITEAGDGSGSFSIGGTGDWLAGLAFFDHMHFKIVDAANPSLENKRVTISGNPTTGSFNYLSYDTAGVRTPLATVSNNQTMLIKEIVPTQNPYLGRLGEITFRAAEISSQTARGGFIVFAPTKAGTTATVPSAWISDIGRLNVCADIPGNAGFSYPWSLGGLANDAVGIPGAFKVLNEKGVADLTIHAADRGTRQAFALKEFGTPNSGAGARQFAIGLDHAGDEAFVSTRYDDLTHDMISQQMLTGFVKVGKLAGASNVALIVEPNATGRRSIRIVQNSEASGDTPTIAPEGPNAVEHLRLAGKGGGGVRINDTAILKGIRHNVQTLNFGTVNAGQNGAATMTLTGVVSGRAIFASVASGLSASSIYFSAWYSAADTIEVRVYNGGGSSIDLSSLSISALQFDFV